MPLQSLQSRTSRHIRWGWLAAYFAAYMFASVCDLVTTDLALLNEGAHEANAVIAQDGLYSALRAWQLTAAGGAAMVAVFAFGLIYAPRVSEHWLARPIRSFMTFYVNPWSRRVIDRSPLHMISLALGMVVLRLLASINNLLIWNDLTGPLGFAANELAKLTTPLTGFMIAIGSVYFLLSMALSPLAVRLLRRVRDD